MALRISQSDLRCGCPSDVSLASLGVILAITPGGWGHRVWGLGVTLDLAQLFPSREPEAAQGR